MEIFHYNNRVDCSYKVALRYDDRKKKGKSEGHSDLINGRFLELVPGKKIVETIQFESANQLFAGEMSMTTELSPQKNGTLVTLTAENVPAGITPEHHAIGMQPSLTSLDRYINKS